MPTPTSRANGRNSVVRSRVEHVFGHQKDRMGRTIRTIGIARAKATIRLATMACNTRRLRRLLSRLTPQGSRTHQNTPRRPWLPTQKAARGSQDKGGVVGAFSSRGVVPSSPGDSMPLMVCLRLREKDAEYSNASRVSATDASAQRLRCQHNCRCGPLGVPDRAL